MRKIIVALLWAGTVLAQPAAGPAGQSVPESQQDAQSGARGRLRELVAQLAEAQARLLDLRSTLAENHPYVLNMQAKIRELETQLAQAQRVASVNQAASPPKIALQDRWWRNPATAQYVGLTSDQQKKMDDVFQQYRLKLTGLNAELERQEIVLEPLVDAEPLDEAKITAQIDRVAQARAELEKANGRMLLGIRKLLTPDQWTKLNPGFSLAPGPKVSAK